jgi:hypothetical protein
LPSQSNQINLDDTPETNQVNLDYSRPTRLNPLSPDGVEDRSAIASIGLSATTGISKDEFKDAIATGNEDAIRQKAASAITNTKVNWAKQMINQYGNNLPDDTLQTMLKAQDPNSVFEDHYAKAYMDFLNWPKDNEVRDNWAWTTANAYPEEWDYLKKQGSNLLATYSYINDKYQDAYGHSTWWDMAKTTAKDLGTLGFYSEAKMRGNVPGVGVLQGLGLGSNLQEQASKLFDLPFDEAKNVIDSAVGNMSPDQAAGWLQSMVGQTRTDAIMSDAFTALNVAGVAGPLGKTAIQKAFTEVAARSAYSRMTTAVSSMIATRPTTIPPAVAAPAMAGNTAESAIRRVTIDNIDQIYERNNPIRTLVDRMSGNYDVLNRQVGGNLGGFGREVANRLSDMIDANKEQFVSTVMSDVLARGDRTPTVELEQNVRRIHQGLADMFRGADNTVLDVGKGIYIPGLNVRMYNVAIGRFDADFFGSEEEALAFAKRQGWAVKGDYAVTPEERPNIARKEALIRSLRTAASNAETFEGATTALNKATKLQRELDAIPRHDTGITVESQQRFRYSEPIGPRMPSEPPTELAGAKLPLVGSAEAQPRLKSTEGTPVAPQPKATPGAPNTSTQNTSSAKLQAAIDLTKQELEGVKKDLRGVDDPKRIAMGDRHIKRLEKDIADYESQLKPEVPSTAKSDFVSQLDAKLGREATFEEIIDALEKDQPLERGKSAEQIATEREARRGSRQGLLRDVTGRFMKQEFGATKEQWKELTKYLDELKAEQPNVTPSEASVVQQGNGYYILHTVFLPEEKDFVRDGLITSRIGGLPVQELRRKLKLGEADTGIPNSWAGGWVNAILGRIRSPAERLSTAENLNRIIATHGPSVLLGMLSDGSKPLAQMPKKYWGDFNRFVKYLQQAPNEETGIPGKWVNTPFDVHDWYMRNIGRAPDPTELQAYFAYRTLMIDDLNMRNMAVMQRKLVMGAKQYAVTFMNEDGKKVTTPFFEGVPVDKFPQNGRVLLVNEATPRASKWNLASRWTRTRGPVIEQDVAEGRAKILHVFNPSDVPMSDLEKRPADYIVSYVNQEKPLGFDHVNAQGGGHMIPKWAWFLKQANINSHYFPDGRSYHIYNGDNTLFNFRTRSEAETAIPHLENVRQLLQNHIRSLGPDAASIQRWETEGGAVGPNWFQQAADAAKETGVPFQKMVDWWVGPNAPYDVNEPIRAVSMGNKIIDMDSALRDRFTTREGEQTKMNLVDATKDGSLMGRAMLGFTQERDNQGLYTLKNKGTESNPEYAHEPAPLIDPITAMERAYGGVVKSIFMWDMKKFSIEHWLEQAKDFLVDGQSVRDNPLSHFYNPKYLAGIEGTPTQLNLESNRRMAADFVGIGDRTSNSLQKMAQDLSDYLFGRNPKRQIEALYNLPKETDYTRWIRNVAFYASQISLKTYFTQASTLSNIYFIAGPQNASKATAAMMMYGWWKMASGAPEVLEGLDRSLARSFGWQPGKFTEAIKLMEGAGFHHIDNTTVAKEGISSAGLQWADNVTPITVGWRTMANAGRTLLDYGTLPFNLGTGTTRTSAFFTAYLETLDKAPGGVIDRGLRDAMLGRASLLDANMSTAFNTRLNKGLFSIPFQFGTYDKNMTELMWGKQLTPREKLALFTSSSVMFGLRGGFYASLGFPLANYVLGKTETAAGYVPGENHMADMAVNGFPSWMFAMLSGFTDEHGRKTWVDFSKWGNKGIQSLEDFVDSDKSMAQLALGAAGGVFGQAWDNTWGMRKAFVDAFKEGGYRITSQDVFQAFKTLSAVSDINKTWLAFQTGKMFTRNDTYVTDVGPVMAAIQGITGLNPIQSSDVWIKQKQLSANDESIKQTQRQIYQEIMRAALAGDQGDKDTHDVHIKNAGVMLRTYIPVEKQNQTIREAFQNVGTSLERRVDMKLYRHDLDTLARIGKQKQ